MKPPHEMSDAEINLEIAELYYPKYRCCTHGDSDVILNASFRSCKDRNNTVGLVNYTNNIADIFPIMVELGVAILPNKIEGGYWTAFVTDAAVKNVTNKDPIRAICECVLLVLRSKL